MEMSICVRSSYYYFYLTGGLRVSLVDEDDLAWPREAGRFRMLRNLWLLASH